MEKSYPLGEDLGGALSLLIPPCGLESAPARQRSSKLDAALAYSQISPLIPLRGLESAHARQRSSKLDAALAHSQISPFSFPLWSVEFIPWKVSGRLMVLESVL